jgi:hypothetical protein
VELQKKAGNKKDAPVRNSFQFFGGESAEFVIQIRAFPKIKNFREGITRNFVIIGYRFKNSFDFNFYR